MGQKYIPLQLLQNILAGLDQTHQDLQGTGETTLG